MCQAIFYVLGIQQYNKMYQNPLLSGSLHSCWEGNGQTNTGCQVVITAMKNNKLRGGMEEGGRDRKRENE